jgi:hypothetical protein
MAGRSEVRGKRRRGCLILRGGFVGIGLIGSLVGKLSAPAQESELEKAERIRLEGDMVILARSEQAVRMLLKDPSSAEFSDGFGRMKHDASVGCGYVNARNSFGAMAGRQPWVAIAEKNIAMVRSPDNQRTFVRTWNDYCTGIDDRDEPIPKSYFGVALGRRPSPLLRPSDAGPEVLEFRRSPSLQLMGVTARQAWFESQNGIVRAVDISATGSSGYDLWRRELGSRHGPPNEVGAGDRPLVVWAMVGQPMVQLSFNPTTEQTLLRVSLPSS